MGHRDGYTAFVSSGVGKKISTTLGLPQPVALRRHVAGRPLVDGPLLVGGHGSIPALAAMRAKLGQAGALIVDEVPQEGRLGGVVVDVSSATDPTDLEALRATLAPALKRLGRCARVVVVGADPASATTAAQRATHRALEGITRSVAKELRAGATANLVLLTPGSEGAALGTVLFLLSARSAYVDGQVFRIGGATSQEPADASPVPAPLSTRRRAVVGRPGPALQSRDGHHLALLGRRKGRRGHGCGSWDRRGHRPHPGP